MNRFALVAVGYNRLVGIQRLLESLVNADYDEPVDLIISLDNCGSNEIEEALKGFVWPHGEKRIRVFPERQGLRKHILLCGDFLHEYEAIAVFEDDLVVSPAFFQYMKQCVEYYADCDDVAGISLYKHRLNVNVYLPFEPEPCNKDIFMMQFAQSWGQVWMWKQWFAFRKWYDEHEELPLEAPDTPELICRWPKSSWLKYHIKYCIAENKYFVYPYHSLSTCYSDVGEHCKEENNYFQVPLIARGHMDYRLSQVEDPATIKYDAFFERKGMENALGLPEDSLCADIYGAKGNREGKTYWLTSEPAPYRCIKQFALNMRPHECNIIGDIKGKDIFLYDTRMSGASEKKGKTEINSKKVAYYFNLAVGWKGLVDHLLEKLKRKAKRR